MKESWFLCESILLTPSSTTTILCIPIVHEFHEYA